MKILSYIKNRKKLMREAEQLVWDYINACRNADQECFQWKIDNPTVRNQTEMDYAARQIAAYFQIDELFGDMVAAVEKCPNKFRNLMALRLALAGYAGGTDVSTL